MNDAMSRLKSALDRRHQQAAPLRVFFRDDDVDEDESKLRRLLDIFLRRRTPLKLGVIPGLLTEAGVRLLAQSVNKAPDLIELNQHGWRHLNHEREGRKCEFGPSRTYDEQFADIALGRTRMNEAFSSEWFPAFIPPWNRCNESALQAIDQLGFRVFSAKQGNSVATGYGFKEVSITLDLYRWRGGASLKPVKEIIDELLDQFSRLQTIGVMLHHKVMDEQVFYFLDSILDTLASSPIVRFNTFKSMLSEDEQL